MLIVHPAGAYVRPHKHEGKSESTHVVEGDVDAAGEDRVDFAAHDDGLRGPRTGAESHVAFGGFGCLGKLGVAGQDMGCIAVHCVGRRARRPFHAEYANYSVRGPTPLALY